MSKNKKAGKKEEAPILKRPSIQTIKNWQAYFKVCQEYLDTFKEIVVLFEALENLTGSNAIRMINLLEAKYEKGFTLANETEDLFNLIKSSTESENEFEFSLPFFRETLLKAYGLEDLE